MAERLHFHFHALEKEMATHSSVLAWRIPGTGESGGLSSVGSHRVRHDRGNLAAATAVWVFVAVHRLSLVAVRIGLSAQWFLLQSMGSGVHRLQQLWHEGLVGVVHRLAWPAACGIFLDQRSNPCLLHRQADP